MAFTPKFRWIRREKHEERVVEFLEKVEQCGSVAAASLHNDVLLHPESVTSERSIAPMLAMIRWWEALRAPEVARWQQTYRVEWDVTDGRNGGAERIVWEALLEIERFNDYAIALVLDLAKVFERVSLPVVWASATHFSFPRKILRVLYGYFEHQYAGIWSTSGVFSFENAWRSRSRASRPFSQGQSGATCFYVLCCRMH